MTEKLKGSRVPNKGCEPRIRFPEFKDGWEAKKLGNLLEFKNGINASKEKYGRGIKFINVLDILNNDFITYSKIVGSVDIDRITLEKYSVKYGDILFQRSSETREEVGTANVYLDKENTATFGGFVIRGRKIGDYDPIFFNKLLKTNSARESITSKSGGSTRYNVGQDILSSIILNFPILLEQKKIGSFLSLIDERIRIQIKIVLHYQSLILNLRDKIFNHKVKFEDGHGKKFPEWQTTNLNSIARIFDGTHQTPIYVDKGIPFYSVENVTADNFNDTKFISEDVFQEENKRVALEKGDILMTRIGDIGTVRLIDWDVCASFYVSLALIKPSKGCDSEYLAQYLSTKKFQKELWDRTIHVAFPKKINLGEIGKCIVLIPCIEEQKKIAKFLSSVNKKIEAEKKILEQYENQKKYLMQNMFI
ncbi:MAG: restriction endonuclease subunit S [Ginsengibacter sp.]